MKRRWSEIVRDYFTFTKRERIGIFVAIVFATSFYFFMPLLKPKKTVLADNAFEKELAQLKITVDSSKQYESYKKVDDNDYDHIRPYYSNEKSSKGELFEFDPNTLDRDGWKRLGLRDRTVETILKFVAKGYKFRQATDIKKIYGLDADEAERLIPYIKIETSDIAYANTNVEAASSTSVSKPAYKTTIIDINAADTAAFIALPGIGSKLATRIISFREKLGGFVSVHQISETYGIADSTFQKIKPSLQCNSSSVHTFDINASDVNQLKAHPYFRWNIANAIVTYRQQHGNYKTLDELKKIDIISEEVFKKISPYLKVIN